MSHVHAWDRGWGIFEKCSIREETDCENQFAWIDSSNHSLFEWNLFFRESHYLYPRRERGSFSAFFLTLGYLYQSKNWVSNSGADFT